MFIMVALLLLLVDPASTEIPLSDMAGDKEARDRLESKGGIGGAPAKVEATEARLVSPSKLPFRASGAIGKGAGINSASVTPPTMSSGAKMPAAKLKAASFSNEEWTDDSCRSVGG